MKTKEVFGTLEFEWSAFRCHGLPLQPLIDDEIHNTPILFHESMRVLPIPPQIRRNAVKFVNAIDPYHVMSTSPALVDSQTGYRTDDFLNFIPCEPLV